MADTSRGKHIVVEFLSVTFAVLFALGLNEWRDVRKQKDLEQTAITNVYHELKINLDMLERANIRNKAHLDSLVGARLQNKNSDFHDFEVLLMLQTIAWDTGNMTGAFNLLEYDDLINIAQMYESLNILKKYGFDIIQAELNISGQAAFQNKRLNNLSLVTTDEGVVEFEILLENLSIGGLKQVIEHLEEKFDYLGAINTSE